MDLVETQCCLDTPIYLNTALASDSMPLSVLAWASTGLSIATPWTAVLHQTIELAAI